MLSVTNAIILAASISAAAMCATACSTDSAGRDSASITECDGAYRDVHGYCRLPNGRFTFESCCEASACAFDAAAVLQQQGIADIEAVFPEDEVCAQATDLDGDVSFEVALNAAIDSFVLDADDYESPLALLENVDPADDAVCPAGTSGERVRCYLDRSSSLLAITYRDELVHGAIYPAENRERIEDNWVFFLRLPELSDHLFWAVVPRFRNAEGAVVAYNYGFN